MADTVTKITESLLKEWKACQSGIELFQQHFPEGATLQEVADKAIEQGNCDSEAVYLFNKCREHKLFPETTVKGYGNSGGQNSGYRNSGYRNSGSWNSWNSGDRNSGYWNSGDLNSGDWNSGDLNSGYFNTETPSEINVFDKPCDYEVWDKATKPKWIFDISPTYWVCESDMSDGDKVNDPGFHIRGGQLRARTYHEACRNAFDAASDEDKRLTLRLPNFDNDKFLIITGIDMNKELNTEK